MSNIPNSAMPHAGGTSTTGADTRNSQQSSEFGAGASRGSTQETGFASSSGSQPSDYRSDSFYSANQRDSGTSLLDRAREHKAGIAVGVAVGAIAAAAIPFMLSGKKRSSEWRDYSEDRRSDLYVDTRDSSTGRGRNSRF